MKIQKVTDPAFRKYGQVLEGYDFTNLIKEMKHTPVPEDVIYVPSVEELEALDVMKDLQNKGYGGLPVQIGYCNGHNKKLNAVEYHRNSEINVAVTDLVLLIGHQQDIEPDHTYDTSRIEAFLVPAGTGIEVYATTLHYAPCHVNEGGFQCVVVFYGKPVSQQPAGIQFGVAGVIEFSGKHFFFFCHDQIPPFCESVLSCYLYHSGFCRKNQVQIL